MRGWSVNLSEPGNLHITDFPVPPLYQSQVDEYPVNEVLFWSQNLERWVHLVSASFVRDLPAGHVQASSGDLAWIEQVVARSGLEGLRYCVAELETQMVTELY